MADVEANRRAQRDIYGAPLGDVIERSRSVLGLNQSRVASLLGISAPMLSQVVTGHRIKIGNPAAAQRLRVMVEVTEAAVDGRIEVADAIARIEDATSGEVLTGTTHRSTVRDVADQVQGAFRRRSSAGEYLDAAALLDSEHPDVARLLRVLGAGSLADATAFLDE